MYVSNVNGSYFFALETSVLLSAFVPLLHVSYSFINARVKSGLLILSLGLRLCYLLTKREQRQSFDKSVQPLSQGTESSRKDGNAIHMQQSGIKKNNATIKQPQCHSSRHYTRQISLRNARLASILSLLSQSWP